MEVIIAIEEIVTWEAVNGNVNGGGSCAKDIEKIAFGVDCGVDAVSEGFVEYSEVLRLKGLVACNRYSAVVIHCG